MLTSVGNTLTAGIPWGGNDKKKGFGIERDVQTCLETQSVSSYYPIFLKNYIQRDLYSQAAPWVEMENLRKENPHAACKTGVFLL